MEHTDGQKEVLSTNTNKRGSISIVGNIYFPFRDLNDGVAISIATKEGNLILHNKRPVLRSQGVTDEDLKEPQLTRVTGQELFQKDPVK